MSRLVTQLSCVLDDNDSIESLDDGSIKLKDEMFLEVDALADALDENDKKILVCNMKMFKKVVENRVRVRSTVDGGRRFSFGAMSDTSTKRKLETENSRNVRPQPQIPQLSKPGSGKSGIRRNQTLSLNQFQNS